MYATYVTYDPYATYAPYATYDPNCTMPVIELNRYSWSYRVVTAGHAAVDRVISYIENGARYVMLHAIHTIPCPLMILSATHYSPVGLRTRLRMRMVNKVVSYIENGMTRPHNTLLHSVLFKVCAASRTAASCIQVNEVVGAESTPAAFRSASSIVA